MEVGKKRLAGDTARAASTDEAKELRRAAKDLKEVVAEQTLEFRLLKKACSTVGATTNEVAHCAAVVCAQTTRGASEKLEIIRLGEESHLSARRTLAKLGIPRATFYRPLTLILRITCGAANAFKDKTTAINQLWPLGDCMQRLLARGDVGISL